MIHLILGRQGSGKTLFLVREAYKHYKQGKTIYANFKLNFPFKRINYNDIVNCKLEDAVVLIDEIHLLLPSRNCMSVRSRQICDSFLSMVRKKGLEVYGTTQTERKVDVRFREEKDFLYICKKYGIVNGVIMEIMHNQDLGVNDKIIISLDIIETFSGNSINYSFIGNDYFNYYDTREIIKVEGFD